MQSHLAASPRCLSPPRHAAGSRRVKATARGSRDAADAAACRRARAEVVQHDIALLPCARGRRAVSGSVTASDPLHVEAQVCKAMQGRRQALAGKGGSYLQGCTRRQTADDDRRTGRCVSGGVGLDGERPGLNSHLQRPHGGRRDGQSRLFGQARTKGSAKR